MACENEYLAREPTQGYLVEILKKEARQACWCSALQETKGMVFQMGPSISHSLPIEPGSMLRTPPAGRGRLGRELLELRPQAGHAALFQDAELLISGFAYWSTVLF